MPRSRGGASGSSRRAVWMIVVVVLAIGIAVLLWPDSPEERQLTTHSAGLTIERLQALSSLTTLKVEVADAQVTELAGHTGGVRVILLVRGDFLLAVDLSAARFENVNEERRTATLSLPPPRVESVRLDHERTRMLELRTSGLWALAPGGGGADVLIVSQALREAQRLIGKAAMEPQLAERARRQAETVLKAFTGALGWTIEVRWT